MEWKRGAGRGSESGSQSGRGYALESRSSRSPGEFAWLTRACSEQASHHRATEARRTALGVTAEYSVISGQWWGAGIRFHVSGANGPTDGHEAGSFTRHAWRPQGGRDNRVPAIARFVRIDRWAAAHHQRTDAPATLCAVWRADVLVCRNVMRAWPASAAAEDGRPPSCAQRALSQCDAGMARIRGGRGRPPSIVRATRTEKQPITDYRLPITDYRQLVVNGGADLGENGGDGERLGNEPDRALIDAVLPDDIARVA